MREQAKPNPLGAALGTAATALVAYFTAVFANFALTTLAQSAVSRLPAASLWAGQLQMPLFFIMLLIATVALGFPYFQRDWDPALRKFSLLATIFLVAYVALRAGGLVDPDIPFHLLVRYAIAPFQQTFAPA